MSDDRVREQPPSTAPVSHPSGAATWHPDGTAPPGTGRCDRGDPVTRLASQISLDLVPLTVVQANRYVKAWHRHHAPIPPGFPWYCVGAVGDGTIRGVAIAGRPTNRNNDDRQTVEVLRVATDGTPNAPSTLLGACCRAARAIGAARIITYTLDEESGSSLRGAGWTCEAVGIESAWHTGYTRTRAVDRPHMGKTKVRWARDLREPIKYEHAVTEHIETQAVLFAGQEFGT